MSSPLLWPTQSRAVSCGAPLETRAQSPSASGPGPSRQNARIWRLRRVEDRASPGVTELSWAPRSPPPSPCLLLLAQPWRPPHTSRFVTCPGARSLRALRAVRDRAETGTGDKGARASAASPPPPHTAQPRAAATSSWILVKLDSDMPRLKFEGPGFEALHSLPSCTVPQAQGSHISYSTLCLGDPPSACDAFFSYPPRQSDKSVPQALLLLPASFPLRVPFAQISRRPMLVDPRSRPGSSSGADWPVLQMISIGD